MPGSDIVPAMALPRRAAPGTLRRALVASIALPGLVASCSAILGLEERPARPAPDGAGLPDASAPLDGLAPEASADAPADSTPLPCDPGTLDSDPANCGECGRVCRSACAAGKCDADRLADLPGAPRGLFVEGGTLYLATQDGTTARIFACPSGAPCGSPRVHFTASADDIKLLAVHPPADLVFALVARNGASTGFHSCAAPACSSAAPVRSEGAAVIDARDVRVPGRNHWIFYTTALTAVAHSLTNGFAQIVSGLRGAELLGHNASYLWGRAATGLTRVSLVSPTLATTALPLSDLPDARQLSWNGGATTLFVANTSTHVCSSEDCVSRAGCPLTPGPPLFATDLASVLYERAGQLVTAPYGSPCSPQKILGGATPALPTTGWSTALDTSRAHWVEIAGARSHVYALPR